MYSPEEQQIEICLLKSSLSGIENDLVMQQTALPNLELENEQHYRETIKALQVARSYNSELDRLNQDNVRLVAKRLQLKKQCEEMARALENVRSSRDDLAETLCSEERDEELIIRKYEDLLREKADRFRKARIFYNEEEISVEIRRIDDQNSSLEAEASKRRAGVAALRRTLAQISTTVPEDILGIIGKKELEDKLQEVTGKCAELMKKRKNLLNLRDSML